MGLAFLEWSCGGDMLTGIALGGDKLTWIDEFKSQKAKFPHSLTADLLRESLTNIVSLAFSPDQILPYFRNSKMERPDSIFSFLVE